MTDIQPGDVVVCVDNAPRSYSGPRVALLRVGEMYRVSGMVMVADEWNLLLGPATIKNGFRAWRFRKVEKADEGFSTWMRTLREERAPFRIPASVDGSAKRQDAAGGLIGEADDSAVGEAETPTPSDPHTPGELQ